MIHRKRLVLRALAFLRPYWPMVAGSYVAMLAMNAGEIAIPIVIRRAVDGGIRVGLSTPVLYAVIVLLGIAIVKGALTYLSGAWTETSSQGVAYDIRNRFHEKLQALSFRFHDESETGQLLARSVQDVDRIRFLTGRAVLNLIHMFLQIIGFSAAMFVVNHRLAAFVFIIVPLLVLAGVRFGARARPLSLEIRDREASLTSRLERNLHGARIVKAFAREANEIDRFAEGSAGLLDVQRAEAGIRAVYLPLMQLLAGAGTVLVLAVGGRMVLAGSLTLGTLVAFMTYLAMLVAPVRRFGWLLSAVAQASASAERIFEILDLTPDIEDAPGAIDLPDPSGELRFEGVSLSYRPGVPVLEDVSFSVAPGERVALLGSTGSGKSSVISLLPRFYDPNRGAVYLDGVDIRRITLKSLRSCIGTVMQDTVLFASSVGDNIAFGSPEANQEQIEAAAQAARIHDFVRSLPKGYDTLVGENGVTLSGGQRQRVAIARAILKDPRILILDDATSSVDTETEQLIQASLSALMEGRTSIIIAHRLSTVLSADQILVLDGGRIAGRAVRTPTESPHDQLLRSSRIYAEVFARQFRQDAGGPDEGEHANPAGGLR